MNAKELTAEDERAIEPVRHLVERLVRCAGCDRITEVYGRATRGRVVLIYRPRNSACAPRRTLATGAGVNARCAGPRLWT